MSRAPERLDANDRRKDPRLTLLSGRSLRYGGPPLRTQGREPLMSKVVRGCLVIITVLAASLSRPGVMAQSAEKRWVVLFHQQNSLPAGAATAIAQAGGVMVAALPEIGAVVATGQTGFETLVATNPSVAE